MGLGAELMRAVPGARHVALGRAWTGVAWFTACVAAVNFGLLLPVAWPGAGTRLARWLLFGGAAVLWIASQARAARLERDRRRVSAQPAAPHRA